MSVRIRRKAGPERPDRSRRARYHRARRGAMSAVADLFRHPRAGGGPAFGERGKRSGIPAFAGMTGGGRGCWRAQRNPLASPPPPAYTPALEPSPPGAVPGRGVAQPGSASHWGCGGRRFESCRPDHRAARAAKPRCAKRTRKRGQRSAATSDVTGFTPVTAPRPGVQLRAPFPPVRRHVFRTVLQRTT